MSVNLERFIKGKRFTQEFNLDDPLNQVLPKVSAGSIIGNAISAASSGATAAAIAAVSGSIAAATQTLSSSGQTICISAGNCVTLPEYDNQTLSISGQTLYISGGNAVTLPSSGGLADAVGYVISSGGWSSPSPPANGSWISVGIATGGITLAKSVSSGGPYNTYAGTYLSSGSRWLRGSDGVWYGGAFSGGGISTISIPAGVYPVQEARYGLD